MRGLALYVLLVGGVASASDPDERTLARSGVEPTRESIGNYLRSLYPSEEQQERIARLVAQLGSSSTAAREFAAQELMTLGAAAAGALQQATHDDEPGVRLQALRLLEAADRDRTAEVLYCAFRVIRARDLTGLAAEVLHVMPLAADEHVRREAREALVATARPQDLSLLLRTAAEGKPAARMACFTAIRTLGGEDAQRVLREATRSPSSRIRLAAAFELANLGDHATLPVLVALLGDPEEWTRFRADATLRAIAGRSLGFEAGAPEAERAPAALRWREWVAGEGRKARWKTPLSWYTTERGRTLVATYTANKVFELDDKGAVVWTVTDIRTPWAVRGLPDGTRLLSSYSDNIVYEYDAACKLVWQSARLPGNITGLDRLANGNIIVAVGTADGQLLEISRDRAVVSRTTVQGRPVSVRALPNGNLLVALHDRGAVAEVDRKGRELWAVEGLGRPYSADRLPSGNILVACYAGRRIAEFDRDKALVWERREIGGLYTAERLSDGSILFADQNAVHRQRRGGEAIWSKPFPGNYLYIDRY